MEELLYRPTVREISKIHPTKMIMVELKLGDIVPDLVITDDFYRIYAFVEIEPRYSTAGIMQIEKYKDIAETIVVGDSRYSRHGVKTLVLRAES
ncbi:MAG: hypothetical protein JZD41_03655 [Thermoproteus sp.]|nr:hypothetical protein [Thermoproteus sp.]